MDRNALTEQRRETVIGLLKGMNIKKSTGEGFDKDDVYVCMQQLCDLYEKSIEELEVSYETELETLKEKYQKYDDNNELYISLIMEAKKSSNDIIAQAKAEVEEILNEGKEKVAQQEKELAELKEGVEAEKIAINEELEASKAAMEAEKEAMKAELAAEREKVDALKGKYNQQMNSMDEEFAEIKTNILRTAGRMDNLKSQLAAEEDEINWNVIEETSSVEFPTAEVEVENSFTPEEVDMIEDAVEKETAEKAITLEDIIADAGAEDSGDAIESTEEKAEAKFDEINLELPEMDDEVEEPTEEISFEGLEELFNDEK